MADACEHCSYEVPRAWTRCPHCGRPSLFPNVRDAEEHEEREALYRRYQQAINDADRNGVKKDVLRFEGTLADSDAVIARSFNEAFRLATTDRALYATFYQLASLRVPEGSSAPDGPYWDWLRAVADTALFGDENKGEIRFGCLTLDGRAPRHYGDCAMYLRKDMIAHRASVFHKNSVLFMRDHDVRIWEADKLPKGYRASWNERAKLCVAKLAPQVTRGMDKAGFGRILLREGSTTEDDDFVEVHVFGPVTIRTFSRVTIFRKGGRPSKARLRALEEKLENVGLNFEVVES